VLEDVAGPVDAGSLAVPHAEDTVVFRLREQVGELAAVDRRRSEIFVHAREEHDVVLVEQRGIAFEREIEPAERRAAVAGDERGGVEPAALVGPMLIEGQAHQRLDARKEDLSLFQTILGVQGEFVRGRHAVSSRDVNARRRWTYDTGAPDGAQISNGSTRGRDDRDQTPASRRVRSGG